LEAFRWTSDAGMVRLGDFDEGDFGSAAFDVSADGSIIVGRGHSERGDEAFIWTADAGLQRLSELSNGADLNQAYAMSPDGRFIVGEGDTDEGIRAFIRYDDGAVRYLGTLLGGNSSSAIDVSDDGRVVIGVAPGGQYGGGAFYWNSEEGMIELKQKLVERGVPEVQNWVLYAATGVSADGTTIVGVGFNPDGWTEAWIATIPEPTTLGFFLLAVPLLATHRND
jgi:uncharacterized membrane protein